MIPDLTRVLLLTRLIINGLLKSTGISIRFTSFLLPTTGLMQAKTSRRIPAPFKDAGLILQRCNLEIQDMKS